MSECAYKSTDPAVLAAWERVQSSDWGDRLTEWGREQGFPEGRFKVYGGSGDARFAGFIPDGDPPAGWRLDTHGLAVPDKRYKAGKAAATWLKDHGDRPGRSDIPGMPREVWVPKGDGSYGYSIRTYAAHCRDGAVWVQWDVGPDRLETEDSERFNVGTVDLGVWERIPMSAYHLSKEAMEAA